MNEPSTKFGLASYLVDIASYLSNLQASSRQAFHQAVVDAPFHDAFTAISIDLGITVLLLVNRAEGMIDRIALSKTAMADRAVEMSAKPFAEIRIPLNHPRNIIAKAIKTGQLQQTDDWPVLFVPALTAQQARFNQAGAGIECSVVHPLKVRDGGAMIFSFFQPPQNLTKDHYRFVHDYSALVSRSLSRQALQSQRS